MLTFKSGKCDYVIIWSKDGDLRLCKDKIKFEKAVNKAVDMEAKKALQKEGKEISQEALEEIRKSITFDQIYDGKLECMKEWSDKKSKDEGFKKEISAILEEIAGYEHKKDDIQFYTSKAVWKKFKDGTASRKDFPVCEPYKMIDTSIFD